MFTDNNSKNKYYPEYGESSYKPSSRSGIFIFIYIFLFFSFLGGAYFFYNKLNKQDVIVEKPKNDKPEQLISTSSSSKFPDDLGTKNDSGSSSSTIENIKAENLSFGHFYEKPGDNFVSSIESYTLPINVKVDVSNYHDVSRKINLDPYINDLNSNGFAMLDNQFSREANNFFDLYRYILNKDIPVVVTSDFLFYYYQNNLKQVFKDVEQNAFYENLWDINKAFYDIALMRYKIKKEKTDFGNDPVLEGARLELAYFATALSILMPTKEQISKEVNLNDVTKFNEQEAENFYFKMPDYLYDDVNKEVSLIRSAKEIEKSPVMLFQNDYNVFSVPDDYKKSAKLNNFYLATRWMNSVFPLYYIAEDCPDCLLDYNDWNINLIAASFITKDFSENQNIKNQWATIYKFISFFSGLRRELTYLHYQDVLSGLFGEDYSVEDIFSLENPDRKANAVAIQKSLLKYSFAGIEGGFARDSLNSKKELGMRILQKSYWPNDYIVSKLTGEDMLFQGDKKENITISGKNSRVKYRSNAFALDFLNIIQGVEYESPYFIENTSYYSYQDKINILRREIGDFTDFTWSDNVYWSTIDIAKNIFNYEDSEVPVYMRNVSWKGIKNYNLFLSSWVNLHLPGDVLSNYNEHQDGGLGSYGSSVCNSDNYVEPNVDFINDLIARNKMLSGMLGALNVTKKTNVAEVKLKEINRKFERLVEISKKELSNESLDYEDCKFLNNFVKLHVIESTGAKKMPSLDGFPNEKLNGVNILSVVYHKDDRKIIVFGPIFKHEEYKF